MRKILKPDTRFSEMLAEKIQLRQNRMYDVEPYPSFTPKTLSEAEDNERLKSIVKRAVKRETAPQYLIDSIRSGIRRCGDGG